MRKFVFTALVICAAMGSFAQDSTAPKKIVPPQVSVAGYDHFMIQLGYTWWNGKPDSIATKGFSRSFNMYFMFAFPFKTNPHLSVALGPGIASDHIFLNKTTAEITGNTQQLVFRDVSDTNHFKKYKLSNAYLEVPVELRWTSKPLDDKHAFKVAVGAKVATMLSAWTKGVDEANKNNQTINDYTEKLKSKRYFNSNRLSLMARLGYGKFSLFGTYSVTSLLKEGAGPALRPMTIGLTLSGL